MLCWGDVKKHTDNFYSLDSTCYCISCSSLFWFYDLQLYRFGLLSLLSSAQFESSWKGLKN